MTKDQLREILKIGMPMSFNEEAFEKFYEPNYESQPFDEQKNKSWCKFLQFDYTKFGFDFVIGEISCSGVEISLKSPNYSTISVYVFYDRIKKELYNQMLIVPYYTVNDHRGKESISQVARTIRCDKDVKKYIKSIHRRFECPVREKPNEQINR